MDSKTRYWKWRNDLRSRLVRAGELLKPHYIPRQQSANRGIFAVDIHARVGLFAQMTWLLYVFEHCERHSLRPYVRLSSPFYSSPESGGDWLGRIYTLRALTAHDRQRISSGDCRISRVTSIEQLGLPEDYSLNMRLTRAHELIERHLLLNSHMQARIDAFVRDAFAGEPVIGLHYRGTDKTGEAPSVAPEDAIDAVLEYARRHPEFTTVYVASDDDGFIRYASQALNPLRVLAHEGLLRSTDGRAVHTNVEAGDPARKAEEALLDCLLLARCNALVRTASFLSGWSSVFNPDIPVVMLNRPYEDKNWFPDREVARIAISAPRRQREPDHSSSEIA